MTNKELIKRELSIIPKTAMEIKQNLPTISMNNIYTNLSKLRKEGFCKVGKSRYCKFADAKSMTFYTEQTKHKKGMLEYF